MLISEIAQSEGALLQTCTGDDQMIPCKIACGVSALLGTLSWKGLSELAEYNSILYFKEYNSILYFNHECGDYTWSDSG